jgi:[ribosomal protein S18]-alanine N-acetyltransferase
MSSDPQQARGTAARGIVRERRPSDAEAIERILREASLSPLPAIDPRKAASHQSAANEVHVCEFGGEVVAVLHWRQVSQEVEIFDVAVDSANRRQGIAGHLLQSVLTLGQERGATEFFLEVRESNAAALALYRKFGFTVAGRRPNYYRNPTETALLLRLEFTG